MSKIIKETEMSLSSRKDAVNHTLFCRDTADVTTFLAHGAVDAQYEIGAKAIVTDSYTGRTARYIATVCTRCIRKRKRRRARICTTGWSTSSN